MCNSAENITKEDYEKAKAALAEAKPRLGSNVLLAHSLRTYFFCSRFIIALFYPGFNSLILGACSLAVEDSVQNKAVRIVAIIPNSAAALAGLQAGDVITSWNGK
jgi:membrane-associated protease RseP (regulator of RpoE activity)